MSKDCVLRKRERGIEVVLIDVNLNCGEKVSPLFLSLTLPPLGEATLFLGEMRVVAVARMGDPSVVRGHLSILKYSGLVDHP